MQLLSRALSAHGALVAAGKLGLSFPRTVLGVPVSFDSPVGVRHIPTLPCPWPPATFAAVSHSRILLFLLMANAFLAIRMFFPLSQTLLFQRCFRVALMELCCSA